MKCFFFGLLLAQLLLPALAAAQVKRSPEEPPTEQLVLHPAAEAKPALRYQLLPPLLDRKPGNAAVIYNRVGIRFGGDEFGQLLRKLSDWASTPLDQLPREEIHAVLAKWESVLQDLHRAARRTEVDWQLPLGEQELFAVLLDDAQKTREFARLLVVQARLQIAEKKFDEAIKTLQTTYALSRHVGSGSTLVHNLIGMAINAMASAQLRELMQQPDAPNLYWALTSYPRPAIDMRSAIESEMNSLYLSYPALTELHQNDHSAAYWEAFISKLVSDLGQWGIGQTSDWQGRLALTGMAIKGYPMAKQYLLEQGKTAEEIDAMPVPQVIAIYTMQVYDELRDEIFKWLFLPYPQAREGMQAAEKLLQASRHREIVPVAQLLLPAIQSARLAEARSERTLAMLRIVEALRMYAAAHDGRLPQRLADVTYPPVPLDPVTGGPFLYSSDGGTAVLEAPLPAGFSQRAYGSRFEIRMAR